MRSDISTGHGARPDLPSLTGLRGLAASVVALAHLQDTPGVFMWHNAVDLFFVLSGFTLSYIYRRETFAFGEYLKARIARIYPLYLVCLILAGAIYIGPFVIDPSGYPVRNAVADFLMQLAMLNAWPVIGSSVHWDAPAWSLSAEWFCYLLLFPLLILAKAPPTTATRLLGIVVASAASYTWFSCFFDYHLAEPQVHASIKTLSDWTAVARAVFGFTAGWIANACFQKRDGLQQACARFAWLIWCAVAIIVLLASRDMFNSHALVFVYPFVILAATDPSSASSRLLASKPLHFLGEISYSIYMTHMIILLVLFALGLLPDSWSLPMTAATFCVTLVVSTVSYFTIEKPARDWVRRLRPTLLDGAVRREAPSPDAAQ
nr:acyltransferase [Bradyrhizobium tropiciagri]